MGMNDENAVEIMKSSGNVFADLGLPDPEEDLLKAQLLGQIQRFMRQKDLTRQNWRALSGWTSLRSRSCSRGRLGDFFVERLLTILNRLGHRVDVRISLDEVVPEAAQTRVLVR